MKDTSVSYQKNGMTRLCNKFVILCLVVVFTPLFEARQTTWPHHYEEPHQALHAQLQESTYKHLQDFQIVIPARTDREYRHLTYVVRHQRKSRVRRDVVEDGDEERLHLAFSGYGHDFRVELEPNHRLLAPSFTVKRIRRGTGSAELTGEDASRGCHYHGRLLSHGSAHMAMSTCVGLTGLLRTKEDDFLLEPVPLHANHTFDSPLHPHILYKRRHLTHEKHPLHYCGKKRHYPVRIPATSQEQTINLLSSGEIEFEKVDSRPQRGKRSVDFSGRSYDVGFVQRGPDSHVTATRKRPRRKSIETLVVADRDMIRNHERDHRDVTTYILTIMNMVSSLFLDRSLDGEVDVVLTGLLLLEDNHELDLDHKADRSLANFCRWQYNLNRNQTKGSDHSILLTGIDICVRKNSPCETLGLAQIGGMCNTRHSCTINEDIGLGLAFTVAHETGHSFGMRHDGQGNRCSKRDGHIMSPTLNGLNGVFTWSPCSREVLADFLSSPESVCLDDHPAPHRDLNFPEQLPGEIYDPVSQCKWQFGTNARLCDFRYEHKKTGICKVLWCQREESRVCETKYMPAAEGTACGDNMWCRRGVCVPHGSEGPEAIDGGWGSYGAWSTCTRTCGGGVQYRERACNNPSPMYGGHHCQGKDKVFQLCNTQKCPPSQVSFREEQCAKFNQKPYRRQYFNWVPFTKYSNFGRGRCELLCKAEGYDFFDMLAERVEDGTPCDSSSYDVCIEGKCQHVGCDLVLGSNATLDACGVCSGDNSTCRTVTGEYLDDVRDSGYYEVVRIPRGARNIRIWEERCCTHSYIAIKSGTSPHTYQLNGNWQVDLFGSTIIGGAQWKYERKSFRAEKLFTAGPLLEDIIVEILVVSQNPGLRYSYSMKRISNNLLDTNLLIPTTSPQDVYQWIFTYSDCSLTCAGGTQKPVFSCRKNGLKTVDNDQCSSTTKPQVATKQCNNVPCPARWLASEWSSCSTSCGLGVRHRKVSCMTLTSSGDVNVSTSECNHIKRPKNHQKCHQKACPPEWVVGSWSKCSRECGRGSRSRFVRCRSGSRTIRRSACDRSSRPKSRERCLITLCQKKYQWFITDWDQCSTSCGEGVQRRRFQCSYRKRNGHFRFVSHRRCRRVIKPEASLVKKCSASTSCPVTTTSPTTMIDSDSSLSNVRNLPPTFKTGKWVAGSWQECSASCGGGVQVRLVKCLLAGRSMTSLVCPQSTRPVHKRSCNTYKCSFSPSNEKPPTCQDNFSWCYLVPQHGQCSHNYFGAQCCKTCNSSVR